jgi:putative Holliday junction resolvase
MRIMGLDFGDKSIGIAISDESGLIASPRDTLHRSNLEKDIARLTELAQKEDIEEILVGMPLSLDGSEGPQARKVMAFVNALRQHSGLRVLPWDERLTTVAAERALIEGNVSRARRRKIVDQVAAAVMLQSYLDYRSVHRDEPSGHEAPEPTEREGSRRSGKDNL